MSEQENSPQDQPVFGSGASAPKRGSRKVLVLTLLIVTVAVVAGVLYYLLQRNVDTSSPAADTNAVEKIDDEAGIVEIRSEGMWPQTIKVKAGQQVTFVNKDSSAHRLVANEDVLNDFDSSEQLATGDSYTYVFDVPGTYKYFDPNDGVKFSGTVEVN